jgi:predicted CXXCH cytochrome family protein
MAHRKANLSTDLSDDHPISLYYYDSYSGNSAEYKHPDALSDDVTLDASGQIQCVSCHDPHDDDFGMFLRLDNSNGQLCQQCHLKTGWDESVHGLEGPQTSAKRNTGKQKTGCAACHATHSAGGRQRLLYYAEEENNCFYCHNGRGKNITSDLENEFQKPSRHPMWETGKHDPLELTVMEERHVECVDCHNPHAARKDTVKVDRNGELEVGKQLPGSLLMLRGVTSGGSVIEAVPGINREYQLCFRCHGDSMNQPSPLVTRWRNEFNIRKEFEPSNISFHPVVQQGKNDNVPSLLSPLTTNTIINCTDCHNNNDLNGIAGPHGSIYAGLLEREYITEDLTIESESAYALCYKCHDRTSILDNESFSLHEMHIRGAGDNMSMDEMGTSCSTCHDPHGSVQQRLINFDATVVLPSGSGLEEFNVNGPQAGSCSLTCHNKDHDPLCYDEDGATDC